MNICLAAKSVYPFHPFGGVQKYVYYFARHLAKAGVNVHVVAPLDSGKPRTENVDGIRFSLIPPQITSFLELPIGWLGVHAFSRQLVQFLKTQEFDLLHAFDMTGLYYARLPQRKPVIAHIFSDNYLCNPIGINHYLSLFGVAPSDIKKPKIALSPWADGKTIACYPAQYFGKVKPMRECLSRSNFTAFEEDYFLKEVCDLYRLPQQKAGIIPVGVDTAYVRRCMDASLLKRSDLGLKEEDFIVLTVNRLAADKGIDQMIRALPAILEKIPNAKLLIVGQGYQEKELMDLVAAKGLGAHVRHAKGVAEKDLYGYYKISDAYICAFSFPGSSVSTLEAMAAGLPIITTAQPWLVRGESNGRFIGNNEPQTIAQAVIDVAIKDVKAQGAVSLGIVKDYDWALIARRAKEYYEQILSA